MLNKRFGGHAAAALQMDVVPGLHCGAHFSLTLAAGSAHDLDTRLVAGMHVQRFWLVATSLGLALQPAFAPLSFAHYARTGARFTSAAIDRSAAQAIARGLDRLTDSDASRIVFRGRIGHPTSPGTASRSVRLPTAALLVTPPVTATDPELAWTV